MDDVKLLTTEIRLMIEVLQTENAALQAENARLREALEWYADGENYIKYNPYPSSPIEDDVGETARKALEGGE